MTWEELSKEGREAFVGDVRKLCIFIMVVVTLLGADVCVYRLHTKQWVLLCISYVSIDPTKKVYFIYFSTYARQLLRISHQHHKCGFCFLQSPSCLPSPSWGWFTKRHFSGNTVYSVTKGNLSVLRSLPVTPSSIFSTCWTTTESHVMWYKDKNQIALPELSALLWRRTGR